MSCARTSSSTSVCMGSVGGGGGGMSALASRYGIAILSLPSSSSSSCTSSLALSAPSPSSAQTCPPPCPASKKRLAASWMTLCTSMRSGGSGSGVGSWSGGLNGVWDADPGALGSAEEGPEDNLAWVFLDLRALRERVGIERGGESMGAAVEGVTSCRVLVTL